MKKYLLLSAVACTLAGCSNDFNPADVVVDKGSNTETKEAPIGFSATNKNMLRDANLEQSHYNFGVFAHKTGGNGAETAIMEDYLVGYMDATSRKGYKFVESKQTTISGDDSQNNISLWSYEKLGWTANGSDDNEYDIDTNTSEENYYLESDESYMSNHKNQYLRYWDESSTSTNFYAYAPYYHSNSGVTYNHTNHKLFIPDGAIAAGYDDPTKHEAMYAATQVAKENYKKDVQLQFKRLVSKIKIGFYEEIEGYGVTIQPLKSGDDFKIVSAVPATQETPYHKYADMLKTAGITLTFGGTKYDTAESITSTSFTGTNYQSTDEYTGEYLSFAIPEGAASEGSGKDEPANRIATSQGAMGENDYSKTEYYGIPKNGNVGLTFHVTFKLHSTTGETILVKDATVWVPGSACAWDPNKQYTYIFKITKNTTGTTEDIADSNIEPGSSKVNGQALYPIVFDGCTVEDWVAETPSDHNIND